MKLRILVLAAALGLAACAQTSTQAKITVSLADACSGYANVLDKLTPMKAAGKLSAAQIHSVDTANALAGPLCGPGVAPTDIGSATALVMGETQVILAIVGGAQ